MSASPALPPPSADRPGRDRAIPSSATSGPVAATIATAARARALRDAGHDVISLAIGEPDFDTPSHIIDAAADAARRGETKYTPITGTLACRDAIRRKLARDNGLELARGEIIVPNGSKQAIHHALAATLEAGDEVIIPAPYWASYPLIAASLGGVPVFVDCPETQGFQLDPDALANAVSDRTRWIVLNFPNNPTGAVCPPATLQAVAAIAARHPQVRVLSDDIYEHLIHDGSRHATLAAVAPHLRDRTLTVGGVSKSYAMTGWRIGWAAGPADLIEAIAVVQGNVTSGASSVAQAATIAALDGPQEPVRLMRARYAQRCDLALAELSRTSRLSCRTPDAAFYLFPSVASLIGRRSPAGRTLATDEAVADAILEETHVAVVAGAAFGASSHIRLSTAADDASLREACRRIVRFCEDVA